MIDATTEFYDACWFYESWEPWVIQDDYEEEYFRWYGPPINGKAWRDLMRRADRELDKRLCELIAKL